MIPLTFLHGYSGRAANCLWHFIAAFSLVVVTNLTVRSKEQVQGTGVRELQVYGHPHW